MSNEEFLEKLDEYVEQWNSWLGRRRDKIIDDDLVTISKIQPPNDEFVDYLAGRLRQVERLTDLSKAVKEFRKFVDFTVRQNE